jgi:hypothetical protein
MLKVYGDRPSVAAADGVDAGAPDLPHRRLHLPPETGTRACHSWRLNMPRRAPAEQPFIALLARRLSAQQN